MAAQRLQRSDTALLVVDLQERLCAAMPTPPLPRVLGRAAAAIAGARALALPVVATEQYPKGLGPTVQAIKRALGEAPVLEKVSFSCVSPPLLERLGSRKQVLLVGMEAHVCVFQTARDLAAHGVTPFVCSDAVLSRAPEDLRVGLDLCQEAGARITTVEAALFDLLGAAGTPEFKAISAAVK